MDITFISDTHTATPPLPGGDILIHAGDLTYQGRTKETKKQLDWIAQAPYKHKIIVPGNHEVDWEKGHVPFDRYCTDRNITYLIDSSVEIGGIKIYGSPRTPEFCGWAYMHSQADIKKYWDMIPEDTNILLTPGPPYGILDMNEEGHHCGCPELLAAVDRVKPEVHVFGHVHEAHGEWQSSYTWFANVAIMNRAYDPVNKPTIFKWRG